MCPVQYKPGDLLQHQKYNFTPPWGKTPSDCSDLSGFTSPLDFHWNSSTHAWQ